MLSFEVCGGTASQSLLVKVITDMLEETGQRGQREVPVQTWDYYLLWPDLVPKVTVFKLEPSLAVNKTVFSPSWHLDQMLCFISFLILISEEGFNGSQIKYKAIHWVCLHNVAEALIFIFIWMFSKLSSLPRWQMMDDRVVLSIVLNPSPVICHT